MLRRPLLALVPIACAAAWWGNPLTGAVAVAATLAFAAGLRWGGRTGWRNAPGPEPASNDTEHTKTLARQVVPVWRRNIDAARQLSERDAAQLLERFASISSHLDVAMAASISTPILGMGAIDDLMERHKAELEALNAVTREALAARAQALQEIGHVGDNIAAMDRFALEVQRIARATQMLSLNAAVEATRAGDAGRGFGMVAKDIQELAAQSRHAATQIVRQIGALRDCVTGAQRPHHDLPVDDEDLALRGEQAARQVLRTLVQSLGNSARNSRNLHEAGRQTQSDIEDILMSLQGQDRMNQMLEAILIDMDRLTSWLQGTPDASAASAPDWLERLEASYTMEQMRTSHHGTAHIDKQAAVEFF